jgi:hypothetical protein
LYDEASGLTQGNFMPHATKRLVYVLHDLWWRLGPAKLEKLLPDMASIPVNDGLWDTAKKFVDHYSFVVFWNRIKCLLNNVASKSIHGEIQGIATDGLSDLNHLLWCSVFEAALHEEIAKTVNHQCISLSNNSLDNIKLLLIGANFELLLKEDGSLLIVIANDFVNNVLPVAINCTIK